MTQSEAPRSGENVPGAETPEPKTRALSARKDWAEDVALDQTAGGIICQNLQSVLDLSAMLVSSGIAPKGVDTREKVAVLILAGHELGMSPMQALQGLCNINGRTTMFGDCLLMRALGDPKVTKLEEWWEFKGERQDRPRAEWRPDDDYLAVCRIEVEGRGAIERTFSIAQARKAALISKDTYQKYLARMLQMRARALAIRDGAPWVLSGMPIMEEVQYVDDTPREVPAVDVSDAEGAVNQEAVTHEIDLPDLEKTPMPLRAKAREEAEEEDDAEFDKWREDGKPEVADALEGAVKVSKDTMEALGQSMADGGETSKGEVPEWVREGLLSGDENAIGWVRANGLQFRNLGVPFKEECRATFSEPEEGADPDAPADETPPPTGAREGLAGQHFLTCPKCSGDGKDPAERDKAYKDRANCPRCGGSGDIPGEAQAGPLALVSDEDAHAAADAAEAGWDSEEDRDAGDGPFPEVDVEREPTHEEMVARVKAAKPPGMDPKKYAAYVRAHYTPTEGAKWGDGLRALDVQDLVRLEAELAGGWVERWIETGESPGDDPTKPPPSTAPVVEPPGEAEDDKMPETGEPGKDGPKEGSRAAMLANAEGLASTHHLSRGEWGALFRHFEAGKSPSNAKKSTVQKVVEALTGNSWREILRGTKP